MWVFNSVVNDYFVISLVYLIDFRVFGCLNCYCFVYFLFLLVVFGCLFCFSGDVFLICVLRCVCGFEFVCLVIVLIDSSVLMVCLTSCYCWF